MHIQNVISCYKITTHNTLESVVRFELKLFSVDATLLILDLLRYWNVLQEETLFW